MKTPINRRKFIKYFTGGLLGAGILPMVGMSDNWDICDSQVRQSNLRRLQWNDTDYMNFHETIKANDEIINGLPESQWTDSVNRRADFFDEVTQGLIKDLT